MPAPTANSGSCFLTPEQKDTLINAVEERPVLWDYKADGFSDVERKRTEYAEVAKIMSDGNVQYTGQHIQTEWKKLRDVFNRTLKKVLNGLKPDQVGWRYWERMQFITETEKAHLRQPFGRGRRTHARGLENAEASTSDDYAYQDLVANYAGSENGTVESGDGQDAEMDADSDMKPFSLQQLVAYADFDGERAAHDAVDDDAPSGSHAHEHSGSLPRAMDAQPPYTRSPRHPDPKTHLLVDALLRTAPHQNASRASKRNVAHEEQPQAKTRRAQTATSSLPSPPEIETHRNSAPSASAAVGDDPCDAFGSFVASQVRTITARNHVFGVMLKKELMDVCFKYEMDSIK